MLTSAWNWFASARGSNTVPAGTDAEPAAAAAGGARTRTRSSTSSVTSRQPHRSRIIVHIYAMSKKATDAVIADIENVIGDYVIDKVLDQPKDQEYIAKLTDDQVALCCYNAQCGLLCPLLSACYWTRNNATLWHCRLSDRNSIQPGRSWVLIWWLWFDWSFARLEFQLPLPSPPSFPSAAESRMVSHSHTGIPRLSRKLSRYNECLLLTWGKILICSEWCTVC